MSDLICRKTMMRCQTPGTCSPHGGCQPLPVTESVFKADYARLEQECERLSNELNNMRISWGLMQSEREAALKQVEGLRGLLSESREFVAAYVNSSFFGSNAKKALAGIDAALSAKP